MPVVPDMQADADTRGRTGMVLSIMYYRRTYLLTHTCVVLSVGTMKGLLFFISIFCFFQLNFEDGMLHG